MKASPDFESFQAALLNAGLDVRHITENVNVPMYRTNIKCINGPGVFKKGRKFKQKILEIL